MKLWYKIIVAWHYIFEDSYQAKVTDEPVQTEWGVRYPIQILSIKRSLFRRIWILWKYGYFPPVIEKFPNLTYYATRKKRLQQTDSGQRKHHS